MAKKEMSMAFRMDGKLASSFRDATREAASQLSGVEKKAKAVQAVQKRHDATALKNLTKSAAEASKAFGGLKNEVVGTFKAAAGFAAAGGVLGASLYGIAKSSAAAVGALGDNAQITGLGVDAFRELAHAAGVAGMAEQEFIGSTLKMGDTVKKALGGNQKAMDAFFRAGVDLRDSHGDIKTTEQLYRELSDVFAGMEDGRGKSNLARDIFGDAGIIPLLNAGSAGMKAMREESRKFLPAITAEDIRNAYEFNNSFWRIKTAIRGVSQTVGKELWPLLAGLHDEIANGIADQRVWLEQELPGWIDAFREELPGLKKELAAAWSTLKEGAIWVNDLAKSMGGWVPLLKTVVKYWLIWRGIRIAYSLAITTREVWRLGASFISALPAMKRAAVGVKAFGIDAGRAFVKAGRWAKSGFSAMAAGAGRWRGTLHLVTDAFRDYARAGIRSMGAASKSAVRFGMALAGKAAGSVASFGAAVAAKMLPMLAGAATALWAATAAAVKFGIALLANPIGLVIAGIVALGAAIYLCVKHWDKIKAAIGAAWEYVKSVFVAGWDMLPGYIQEPILEIVSAVTDFGTRIYDAFCGIWDRAVESISSRFSAVSDAFDQGFLAGIVEIAKQFNPVGLITDILDGMVDVITEFDIVSAGMNLIKSLGEGMLKAWDGIKDDIAAAVTDWIPGGEYLVKGAGKVADGIGGAASWVGGKLSSISPFANGGIVRSPQLGLVGEAGPEVIVPVSRPGRGREMLHAAAGMLGGSSGQGGTATYSISFSPTIQVQGGADASIGRQIEQACERVKADFIRTLDRALADRAHHEQRLRLR